MAKERGESWECVKAKTGTSGGVVAVLCFFMLAVGAGMLFGYQKFESRYRIRGSNYILGDDTGYDDFN